MKCITTFSKTNTQNVNYTYYIFVNKRKGNELVLDFYVLKPTNINRGFFRSCNMKQNGKLQMPTNCGSVQINYLFKMGVILVDKSNEYFNVSFQKQRTHYNN